MNEFIPENEKEFWLEFGYQSEEPIYCNPYEESYAISTTCQRNG
jgi:hypothetical protein